MEDAQLSECTIGATGKRVADAQNDRRKTRFRRILGGRIAVTSQSIHSRAARVRNLNARFEQLPGRGSLELEKIVARKQFKLGGTGK
jgi:hypothetical protein